MPLSPGWLRDHQGYHSHHRTECKGPGGRVVSKGGSSISVQTDQDAPPSASGGRMPHPGQELQHGWGPWKTTIMWVGPLQRAVVGKTLPSCGDDLPLQWVQKHWAKEDYSPGLRPNGICPDRFWIWLGSATPFFFPVSPFWNGDIYPILTHHCILETQTLLGFRVSQLGRNFASG